MQKPSGSAIRTFSASDHASLHNYIDYTITLFDSVVVKRKNEALGQ